MKALILNSGIGKRMMELTVNQPKCMVEIGNKETILSWQLHALEEAGIKEVVITTGPFEKKLRDYVESINSNLNITYVNNPKFDSTNYIYSIWLARDLLDDDILLMHGDLVIEQSLVNELACVNTNSIIIDSAAPLPDKDFKARKIDDRIFEISINIFDDFCIACQPAYFFKKADFNLWLNEIDNFCAEENVQVYAENALNNLLNRIKLHGLEQRGRLCNEIDSKEDLLKITTKFRKYVNGEDQE
jgi:choline kinase